MEGAFVRGGCYCWLFCRLFDEIALQQQDRPPGTGSASGVVCWGLGERVFIGVGG